MGIFFIVSGNLFVVIQYYFSLLLLDFSEPGVKRSDGLGIDQWAILGRSHVE
jgi:hypothetical protein